MNLSLPLTAITTPTLARVLRALAGTTMPMSGREVRRIAGADVTGTWRALSRLEEHGLVLADHRSQLTHFTANRDHLAWPAIEQLVHMRQQLFERLAATIATWSLQPIHGSIFGSSARGDSDVESDIDLLLIHSAHSAAESERWDAQISSLRDQIRRWTGNEAQVFDIDTERLAEHVAVGDPLIKNWLSDGLVLSGEPLRALVDRL